jgi:hypothetical protein
MRLAAFLLAWAAGVLQALGPSSCCLSWNESGCTCCYRVEKPRKACCPCHAGKEAGKKAPEKKCSKGHAHGMKPGGAVELPAAEAPLLPFETPALLLPAPLRLARAPEAARDVSLPPPPTPLRI